MPKPQPKMDLDFLVTELSMVGDHLLIDRMETDDGSTARFHVRFERGLRRDRRGGHRGIRRGMGVWLRG
jgi:hypothetical protein